MRVLADTVDWSANEFGEYAHEAMRDPDPDSSPLLLVAKGATDLRRELLAAPERAEVIAQTRIETRVRETEKEQLYLKASGAWHGKGKLPTRAGVPRSDADYKQDLSKAVPAAAPPASPPYTQRQARRSSWSHPTTATATRSGPRVGSESLNLWSSPASSDDRVSPSFTATQLHS